MKYFVQVFSHDIWVDVLDIEAFGNAEDAIRVMVGRASLARNRKLPHRVIGRTVAPFHVVAHYTRMEA